MNEQPSKQQITGRGKWRFMLIGLCVLFLIILGCRAENESSDDVPPTESAAPAPTRDTFAGEIQLQTFQAEQGWGYDVYIDGRHYIHQAHQPAVGGRQGFATQEQAAAVGALVSTKIRKGIIPPSVSAAEVDSLIRSTQ